MNWYLTVWKKYAVFSGRARRKEYWFFLLFNIIITIALFMVDGAIGTLSVNGGIGLLSGIYSLAVLIPSLAVGIRRLHDTDRSGWWLLIGLIPVIGSVAILVLMVLGGTPGDNRFGTDPKSAQDPSGA
jgi:uncharacterized membrane protein YhaH (DUF805 family)